MELVIIVAVFIILVSFVTIEVRQAHLDSNRQKRIEKELLESVTTSDRGTLSERDLVLTLLKAGTPAQTIFHDLYIRKSNGGFSQIDLVVPTKVGIIVFEVKDYSGWIFGNGNHTQWTEVLAYGQEKYRFYNPIMQNNGHIAQLRKRLRQFENIPFYSIIVFYGDCELRNIRFVPYGTFVVRPWRVLDVVNSIINTNKPANYTDKREIIAVLKEAVENGGDESIRIQHIKNIKNMLGKERIFK
ncbi:MAG: NERD domain-containing protein [Treponema sp.]|nr:NERD domain-containing protein [Treponema sp.]